MTIIFADGSRGGKFGDVMEQANTFGAWTATEVAGAGTITVSKDWYHHGHNCAKSIKTANTDEGDCYKTISATGYVSSRMYIRIAAVNMGDNFDYDQLMLHQVGASPRGSAVIRNTGNGLPSLLVMESIGFTMVDSNIDLATNTIYLLELETYAAVAGFVKLYLNDILVATKNMDTSAWALTRCSFGDYRASATSIHSMTLYHDCWAISNNSHIGPDIQWHTRPRMGLLSSRVRSRTLPLFKRRVER